MEYKTLYFPLFYETVDSAEPLSDEVFGRIIRIASKRIRGESAGEELTPELLTFCNTIVNTAHRIFTEGRSKRNQNYGKEYDSEAMRRADEGFEKALARSYGDNKNDLTSMDNGC